ncbi:MAG: LCP family protein [Christensenellales bacterium]|jgi:LCP family protein required for cell wall assembly
MINRKGNSALKSQAGSRELKPKRKFKKRRVVIVALTGFIVIALAIVGVFASRILNPKAVFNDATPTPATPTPAPTNTAVAEETPTPTPTIDPAILDFLKDRVNILVLGIDSSTERVAGGNAVFRSDTIILVSCDFEKNQVHMFSIPRDTYCKIYNRKERNKINAAFALGGGAEKEGFTYAMNTVSTFTGGIPIQYYVGFNMNVVKDVVNAMGGVDYDVDVDVYMNGRTLKKGMQHLDGQGVLDYSRMRKGSSDIARVDRQQRILFAIFDQMKTTKQLGNIPNIYNAVEENIYTNLSAEQILALSVFATRLDGSDSLKRYTAPGDFLNIDGISYWGSRESAKVKMLEEIFGVTVKADPENDVTKIKAAIEVERKAISSKVAEGQAIIKKAKALITDYAAVISSEEKASLEKAIRACEGAVDSELLDEMNAAIPKLNSAYNTVLASCKAKAEEAKKKADEAAAEAEKQKKAAERLQNAIAAGNSAISTYSGKLAAAGDTITEEQRASISSLISDLQAKVSAANDAAAIEAATSALVSAANPILP